MKYEFSIPALPPSVNHIYKRSKWGGQYKAKTVETFEQEAALKLKLPTPPLKGLLYIYIEYYFADNKKFLTSDVDNLLKVTLDTFSKFEIIENDKYIVEIFAKKIKGDFNATMGWIRETGEVPKLTPRKKRLK